MKISRTLSITTDEFFDYLENQLLKIANDNLDKEQEAYTNTDIQEGFRIIQNRDTAVNKVELLINKYKKGELYEATASSITDSYRMSYQITPKDDTILVDYEQVNLNNFQAESKGFFAKLGEALYLSRMSNSLYDVERAVLKARTN